MTRTPTPEQEAILACGSRVRIIRASPGSGKTWLIAELVRRELDVWPHRGGGMAALSFTRVGGQEIRNALGHDPLHPHYVGTIDAFLFKYVVRPFFSQTYQVDARPRLIPADWSPGHWSPSTMWTHRGNGGVKAISYNLLVTGFVGMSSDGPILKFPGFRGSQQVSDGDRDSLLAAKRNVWEKYGWLTHADAAFVASEILSCPTRGAAIRQSVLLRFPMLVVDELQDTGFFLGKCVQSLLGDPGARGVLVGDPDQTIYEFNGARPDLFSDFIELSGATVLPLKKSLRCPTAVMACASEVKDSGGSIDPADGKAGAAYIVEYGNMATDVRRLVQAISASRPGRTIKIITRRGETVDILMGKSTGDAVSLHCRPLNHLLRAVKELKRGRNVRALAAARAALDFATFGKEGLSETELSDAGVDLAVWKQSAIRLLLKCNAIATTGTHYDWQSAAGKIFDEIASSAVPETRGFQSGKVKPQKRDGWDANVCDLLPVGASQLPVMGKVPVLTVHGVKGETHDVTVFVCPPDKPARCPSTVWWSTLAHDREERRIAYVAMTRSRADLILCLSQECRKRFIEIRQGFIEKFKSLPIDDLIAHYLDAECPP